MLALPPFLSGCAFWSYGVGSGESESATVTYDGPAPSDAEASLQGAIPAIETYYPDNGTYAGMTSDLLRERYDSGLGDVRIVVASGGERYCVETPLRAPVAHYEGPVGPVVPGPC